MVVHPLLIHFPIALLVIGTVGLIWDLVRPVGQIAFDGFLNGTLGLGYAGLLLTIITGLFDMQAGPKTLARDGWIVIAVLHILTAVSLLVSYGFLLYRRFVILPPPTYQPSTIPPAPHPFAQHDSPIQTQLEAPPLPTTLPSKLDWLSLGLAIVGLVLLVGAGWLGGRLVYEYRVGI